jgi:drug/metabolite transporter (DMT)-like permease
MAVPWSALVVAVGIHVLWGGNVVAIKFGFLAIPPLWSAFWRFLLAAICLMAWARLNRTEVLPTRAEWPALLLLSALFTVQIVLMNFGIKLSTGAISAILISTNPLFAGLLSHFFMPGDRLTALRGVGLAIAFAGICLIFVGDTDGWLARPATWGSLVVLVSAALLGARLVFTAALLRRMQSTRVVMWQMILALPCFAAGGWLLEEVDWDALGWVPLAGIAYQGFVIAALGFMVTAHLMRRYSPSVVISFNFVTPVSGVFLSALLLAETIGWHLWAGLGAVGLGLILITRR